MTKDSQIDFENILFPREEESKKEEAVTDIAESKIGEVVTEIKDHKIIQNEEHDEYCAQCDRGDFCSKHTTRAA